MKKMIVIPIFNEDYEKYRKYLKKLNSYRDEVDAQPIGNIGIIRNAFNYDINELN